MKPSAPLPPASRSSFQTLLRRLAGLPRAALNSDLDPIFNLIFARLEFAFVRLERWIPLLRSRQEDYSLNRDLLFDLENPREQFLPLRFPTLVKRLVASRPTPEDREFWRLFARRAAERLHCLFFRDVYRLNDAFAPFDPEGDSQFETEFSPQEREERRQIFFDAILKILREANFVELPKSELERCQRLKRPGSVQLVARYDEFSEYRVFVRGVVPTEPIFYPRWKCAGRVVEIKSERLSRVCVLARSKSFDSSDADDSNAERSEIIFKMFKNVLLEDLKLVAPRVELTFPIFDGVKIGGGFLGAVLSATLKLALASAITFVGFFVLLTSFILASVKGAVGFMNRRTKYWERYSSSLYFQTLASNRAAISLLVGMAEEQEAKEFILGYFAATLQDDWATEREIDETAERWLFDNFNLRVDFESTAVLDRLLAHRLLERRVDADATRFRAVEPDEALRRLAEDWSALGTQR